MSNNKIRSLIPPSCASCACQDVDFKKVWTFSNCIIIRFKNSVSYSPLSFIQRKWDWKSEGDAFIKNIISAATLWFIFTFQVWWNNDSIIVDKSATTKPCIYYYRWVEIFRINSIKIVSYVTHERDLKNYWIILVLENKNITLF